MRLYDCRYDVDNHTITHITIILKSLFYPAPSIVDTFKVKIACPDNRDKILNVKCIASIRSKRTGNLGKKTKQNLYSAALNWRI